MNFVDDMELNTNAMFVGEPTGETPNMWGDPVSLTLPNSGIVVQASALWWQLEDPRDHAGVSRARCPGRDELCGLRENVDPALKAIFAADNQKKGLAQNPLTLEQKKKKKKKKKKNP